MKVLSKELYRTGEIVSPYRSMRMFESLRRDLERVQARRYYHTACRIPFDDINNTDGSAEKQIYVKPPFDVNIDFVELRVFGTVDKVFTVSASGVTNWEDISVTADGAGFVEALSNNQCGIDANTECVFTISSDGTWSITAAELILHVRRDRGNSSTAFDKPAIKAGAASDVDNELVTPFSVYDTIAAEETALNSGGAFTVDVFRNLPNFGVTSYIADAWRHMATGQTLASCDFYLVASGTASWDFKKNLPTVTTTSLTAAGTGTTVKAQNVAINQTSVNGPTNSAYDYRFWIDKPSAGAPGEKLYAVTYYT